MEERKLTCIGCPMGCQLQVIIKDGIVAKSYGEIPVKEEQIMERKR